MSIAKNLIQSGTWGINAGEFASASSSPFWVLLLSASYLLTGVNLYIPLILNILFQILTIYLLTVITEENQIEKYRIIMILLIISAAPFAVILFTGLEHSLQIFLTLALTYYSCKLITGDNLNERKFLIFASMLSFIAAATRFESLFLIIIISLLLFLKKKYSYGSLIFLSGLLPIFIFGFISISNGWYFLPNSILLKSNLPALTLSFIPRMLFRFYKNMTEPQILFVFITASFLFYLNYKKDIEFRSRRQIMLIIFILTAILHELFAQNGGFFRYEAYLITMGATAISINAYGYLKNYNFFSRTKTNLSKLIIVTSIFLITSPLWLRAFTVFLIPPAINNTYKQHYFLGEFIKQNPEMNIAVNDIGIMSYYSQGHIVDLWGLANIKAAEKRLDFNYDTNAISETVSNKNTELCILYEKWFEQFGGLPKEWVKIGDMSFADFNLISGSNQVDFYAPEQRKAETLREKLKLFFNEIPNGIERNIY